MYYPNDANWVDIFGTSDANTCVSLFYEKLERSFELFVPVLRSPARPMVHKKIAKLSKSQGTGI
jgi:hypothetical protein